MPQKYSFRVDTKSGAYAWKQMQNWHAKSRQHRENFESTMSAAASTFSDVTINNAQTLGQIAAQRAIDRIKAASAAKQAATQKTLGGANVDMVT